MSARPQTAAERAEAANAEIRGMGTCTGRRRESLDVTVVCMRSDEDHIVARAEMLRRAGNMVRILGLSDFGGRGVTNASASVRTRLLERISPGGALSRLSRFSDALRSDRADIWHVHYACGYHAFIAGALKRRPMAVSTMGGDILFDEQTGPTRLERFLARLTLQIADLVTVKSSHSREVVRRLGVSDERIRQIVWGVDTTLYRPSPRSAARRSLGLPETGTLVLSVRQLKALYNIDTIVRAFARVSDDIADASLYIMRHGSDPVYESDIRRLVATLGLEGRVVFVDPVEPERMPLWYGAADLIVGIPDSDALPQTLLEAMACERVTICPDDERYAQFARHGETAFRVARKPEAVADALSEALTGRATLEKMQRAARALIEECADREAIAMEVDACLRGVVTSPGDTFTRRARVLYLRALLSIGAWLVALAPRFAISRSNPVVRDRKRM